MFDYIDSFLYFLANALNQFFVDFSYLETIVFVVQGDLSYDVSINYLAFFYNFFWFAFIVLFYKFSKFLVKQVINIFSKKVGRKL